MGVDEWQPVAMRRAAFWTTWRRWKPVLDIFGAQIGAAKLSEERTRDLNVVDRVSLEAPQAAPAVALRILRPPRAFAAVAFECAAKEKWVSKTLPRILGVLVNSSGALPLMVT